MKADNIVQRVHNARLSFIRKYGYKPDVIEISRENLDALEYLCTVPASCREEGKLMGLKIVLVNRPEIKVRQL